MYTNSEEAAYCITRIARSKSLAAASTDTCARASHMGIAEAYGDRLMFLTRSDDREPRTDECEPGARSIIDVAFEPSNAVSRAHALARWDNEGGALFHRRKQSPR